MEKPILKNEIEAKINGTANVEDNIAEAKEYALNLKEYYSKLVFTEDQIGEAKEERASINKVIKKIADYRKNIIAEFKKPIELFETTAKETEKILKETADFVDVQVKNYEEQEKQEKREQINAIYEHLMSEESISEIVNLDMLFDERYLNKTYKIDDVEKDLSNKIKKIVSDINSIKDLESEYEVSLINNYLQNYDLGSVITENKRLQELKQTTQKVKEKQEEILKEKINEMLTEEIKTEDIDPIKEYVLRIKAPLSKQKQLRQFLELNKMDFEKIEG